MSKVDQLWKDLAQWQKEIDAKDQAISRRKPVHDQTLPPVRPSTTIQLDNLKPVGLNSLDVKQPTSSTQTERAEAEKAKGNDYFVKKDYANAIQHYGQAIQLNPTVPVYFVNRAMAYLKLNRFLEAEKDCTQGLLLQPKNVKALWRRGIALKGLGRVNEARKDLEHALTIEPNNKSILDELNKLPPPVAEKRRLPVKVIDAAYSGPKGPAKVTAIVTPTDKSTKAEPAKAKPTKVEPVKAEQAKKVEPTKKVEPVKAQPVKAQPVKAETSPQKPLPKATLPLKFTTPRTNFEFERDWKTYKARGDDILYQYFQCIPPSSFANLFKSSLESDQFEKMIDLLETRYLKEKSSQETLEVIQGLSQVKRLDMLIMFLDRKRQQALQGVFDVLKQHVDQEKLSKLAKIYGTRI
ncbi:RNA polymerase II-associated protein 3 [Choanephora cucurbitarum]|uniref:RNA polymerase II-associated protein 3 n=1 Tax=Choanephora cucurbitarum TaxID=101091 RepID=A0A1C7N522_9FUNG|nr:RNA polymerase II-associated protein 3 [Choanephora cucurbitarum]